MAQTQHMEIWKKIPFRFRSTAYFSHRKISYFFILFFFLSIMYYMYIFSYSNFHCDIHCVHYEVASRVREWKTFFFLLGIMKNAWFSYIKLYFSFYRCGRKFFSWDKFKHVLENWKWKFFSWWERKILPVIFECFKLFDESSCKSFFEFEKIVAGDDFDAEKIIHLNQSKQPMLKNNF